MTTVCSSKQDRLAHLIKINCNKYQKNAVKINSNSNSHYYAVRSCIKCCTAFRLSVHLCRAFDLLEIGEPLTRVTGRANRSKDWERKRKYCTPKFTFSATYPYSGQNFRMLPLE